MVFVACVSGVGSVVGVGASPHPSYHSSAAGPGRTPHHPQRRIRRQRNRQEELHHQMHRGHQEGELISQFPQLQ